MRCCNSRAVYRSSIATGNSLQCGLPGFVKTAHGLREISELDQAGQEWEEGALADAQGRICEPEEVSSAVVFLASDEASFITGNALYVDNGWYAKG